MRILSIIVVVFALVSCSDELYDSMRTYNVGHRISVTLNPFIFDSDSRTNLENTGNIIHFTWDDDECIGVFPVSPTTNTQACQSLNDGVKSNDGMSSSFDGAGWLLREGNTYAAYYPYNGTIASNTGYTSVPFDMTGQMQKGNSSLAHIGQGYDYMYSSAIIHRKVPVEFVFDHLCSIVMLQLRMPVAAEWTNISLTNAEHESVFITKGTFDASNGNVKATEKSKTISMDLSDITTESEDEILTFYMAVIPTLTGDMTVKATASNGNIYAANLKSRELKAGYAYKWSSTPIFWANYSEDGYGYVDLGLASGTKWANMNVGATTVEDTGKYYAWGETKGYGEEDVTNTSNYKHNNYQSYIKTYYGRETHKYVEFDSGIQKFVYTKYCFDEPQPNGFFDGKNHLDLSDDAAYVNMGEHWRMPTHLEQYELSQKTFDVWTSDYNGTGVPGIICFKTEPDFRRNDLYGHNLEDITAYSLKDVHIFLPLTGEYEFDWYEHYSDYSDVISFPTTYICSELRETGFEMFMSICQRRLHCNNAAKIFFFAHPIRAVRR